MKVIMLSKVFPKGHRRAGEATRFRYKFSYWEKLHTIRANSKGYWEKIHTIRANSKGYFRDGENLSVRQWTGQPYRSKQYEIGVRECGVVPIKLYRGFGLVDVGDGDNPVVVPINVIAENDGLEVIDFMDWFFPAGSKHEFFEGVIVHFTDFRY